MRPKRSSNRWSSDCTPIEIRFTPKSRHSFALSRETVAGLHSIVHSEALHGAKDLFPLPQVQEGGGAATEENRLRSQIVRDQLQLAHERRHVTGDDRALGGFGVKRAILALVRAKRHVDVKALDGRSGRFRHGVRLSLTPRVGRNKKALPEKPEGPA